MNLTEIGKSILSSCMDVKPGEKVLIVTDDEKYTIGKALYDAANELGADGMIVSMKPREVSGQEPPESVAAAMKAADVVIAPMATSITHTNAKIEAQKAGARIATMPGITDDMFMQGAITADYSKVLELTGIMTQKLTEAKTARIEKDGHTLVLNLDGRNGIPSPGVYREKGQAGNLPSGEAYIAPVEDDVNGTMIIDGSMVGIGILNSPLTVEIKDGRLISVIGEESDKLQYLLEGNNSVVAELGIGTNYAARITGVILEDEKAYHTVHIAFGTNTGFGGVNKANCHIDGIIKNPTLYLDDVKVMDKGEFILLSF